MDWAVVIYTCETSGRSERRSISPIFPAPFVDHSLVNRVVLVHAAGGEF